MHFIHNQKPRRRQPRPPPARQHQIQTLRRRNQNMRRPSPNRRPILLRRIPRPHPHLNLRPVHFHRGRHLRQLPQRPNQILLHIIRQTLQRRHIQGSARPTVANGRIGEAAKRRHFSPIRPLAHSPPRPLPPTTAAPANQSPPKTPPTSFRSPSAQESTPTSPPQSPATPSPAAASESPPAPQTTSQSPDEIVANSHASGKYSLARKRKAARATPKLSSTLHTRHLEFPRQVIYPPAKLIPPALHWNHPFPAVY